MNGITLILGSGGARGLCFIGALRALSEARISIHRIIGSSMGAIVGAAYASGTPLSVIESKLLGVKPYRLLRPSIVGPGIFSHTGISNLVRSLLSVDQFEKLLVPLTVACTDVQTGGGIAISSGDLVPPVSGSSIIAGLFNPVSYLGGMLVDGGYTAPLPVAYHDRKTVAVVIDPTMPVDWKLNLCSGTIAGVFRRPNHVFLQCLKSIDILVRGLATAQLDGFECVHIIPELGTMKFTDFRSGKKAILAGERAVKKSLSLITSKIEIIGRG